MAQECEGTRVQGGEGTRVQCAVSQDHKGMRGARWCERYKGCEWCEGCEHLVKLSQIPAFHKFLAELHVFITISVWETPLFLI